MEIFRGIKEKIDEVKFRAQKEILRIRNPAFDRMIHSLESSKDTDNLIVTVLPDKKLGVKRRTFDFGGTTNKQEGDDLLVEYATFRESLPKGTMVELMIVDADGRKIDDLVVKLR
ncbi:MAG: hypothetical protein PVJ52_00370 [Candidatus Woesebacteria bacterium]|jgi:hypothetical protein